MTRTAIVPVEATQPMLTKCYGLARAWPAVVDARPAVPDELIEEAAEMIYLTARRWRVALGVVTESWQETTEAVRNEYREMARAAARVFNGGKDE